jgi:nitrilase
MTRREARHEQIDFYIELTIPSTKSHNPPASAFKMPRPTVRVAAAHISPVLLDAAGTTKKILSAIAHAASHKASIIAFPESLLPGFPIWSALIPPASRHTAGLFARFTSASCHADSPEIRSIRAAAKKHNISVSLGFSESKAPNNSAGRGTLWNSNLLIDANGSIEVHHRKLRPTFYEQLSWSGGDGHGLRTATLNVNPLQPPQTRSSSTPQDQTHSFSVGTLICGENTNSLARHALLSQAQDLHISTWPAIWPTQMPEESSANSSSSTTSAAKDYDNVLANRVRAAAHCFEAKCYGMLVAAHLSESNITTLLDILRADNAKASLLDEVEFALRIASRAPSMVLDPTGTPVEMFTFADFESENDAENEFVGGDSGRERQEAKKIAVEMLREEEGVLFADLDLEAGPLVEGKQFHDLLGGYQRFDVFKLNVDRRRKDGAVVFNDV